MSLQSWGRAGGWTAVVAVLSLMGMVIADRQKTDQRIAYLERSSYWQETVLYLLAKKAGVWVPPRPAVREARPDPDTTQEGLFAADTDRTLEGGSCR